MSPLVARCPRVAYTRHWSDVLPFSLPPFLSPFIPATHNLTCIPPIMQVDMCFILDLIHRFRLGITVEVGHGSIISFDPWLIANKWVTPLGKFSPRGSRSSQTSAARGRASGRSSQVRMPAAARCRIHAPSRVTCLPVTLRDIVGCGRRYARGWLGIDLISSIPFDWLFLLSGGGGGGATAYLRLLKAMRLLKLARLARLNVLLQRIEEAPTSST